MLHEIGHRLRAAWPESAAIYLPTPWIDEDVPYLIEAFATNMMGMEADDLRSTVTKATTAGIKVFATAQHVDSRSVSPPRLSTWAAFGRQFASRAGQAKPTLLLVDEIQRMGGSEATRNLLYHLHDQSTFPVTLVCGGLSTSSSHLHELGLSRVADANVLHIGALDVAEAEQCLDESLALMAEEVGITGHPDHWARQLASATHGWPQHITCHIRAAAMALQSSGRLAFDDANLHKARKYAEGNMRRHYDQRLATSFTDAAIVFAVHESVKNGRTYLDDAVDLVEATAHVLSGSRRSRHDARFADAMDCVQQMLHAGLIAYAGNTTISPLTVPIPSLAAHIGRLLSPEQREAIHRTLAA